MSARPSNAARDVLVALADANVAFVVCGGVAVILQGVNRMTHDLDLRVDLDDENLRRFLAVARGLGLRARVPEPLEALASADRRRVWVEEKGAVVYTLVAPTGDLAIDVFLRYPISFADLRARADVFPIGGRDVHVSSKADLIAAKRAVIPPRKQDLRDIEDLQERLDEGG